MVRQILTKLLNGVLCSYRVDLPNIFLFIHPIGTVLGSAEYQDYLVVYHHVTVNMPSNRINDKFETIPQVIKEENKKGLKIGKGVFLATGATIIGDEEIGDFSSIGVNTLIYKTKIPSNSIAYTDAVNGLVIKKNQKKCAAQDYFFTDFYA